MGSSLRYVGPFIAVHGPFFVVRRLLSSCGAGALECTGSVVAAHGLSSCGAWAPEHTGAVVVARGLSSCGTWAW